MSQLPKRKGKPDGYRPVTLPKAMKMINGGALERNEQDMNIANNELQKKSEVAIKRIDCVYLPASNTEESAKWYMDYLGMRLKRPVHEDQAQLEISPEQSIFLIRSKEAHNVNYTEINGNEQCILTFEAENFEGLFLKMKDSGARISDIEDNGGCGFNFYAYDPAGNKLDIWGGWPK